MSQEQQGLREALKRVAVTFKQGGIPFALGGGYAGWALGGPEPEHDVDFLVAEHDALRARELLEETSMRVEQPPEDWLFKVFDGDAMVDVVLRVGSTPVEPSLLERAEEHEVLSVWMPVLGATDLLITKMLALSEHSCDYGKVLPSARALREQVDWQRVREATEHNPFAAALLVLLHSLDVAPE
jgi:hypothetical protein